MTSAAVEQGYSEEEAAALAQMADALARFGNAIDACASVGIDLPGALEACGIAIPGWAHGVMRAAGLPGSLAPRV